LSLTPESSETRGAPCYWLNAKGFGGLREPERQMAAKRRKSPSAASPCA